jgi:hypothetical protein
LQLGRAIFVRDSELSPAWLSADSSDCQLEAEDFRFRPRDECR